MQLEITVKALKAGLAKISGAVDKHTTIPILACVRIDAWKEEGTWLTGTDLETAICVKLSSAIILEKGSVIAPFGKLKNIVSAMKPQDVLVLTCDHIESGWETAADTLLITRGAYRATIPAFPPDLWPTLPQPLPNDASFSLPSTTLKKMTKKVTFATSKDESRYSLNAVLLEAGPRGVRLVATDGHQLCAVESVLAAPTEATKVLVPTAALVALTKLANEETVEVSTGVEAHIHLSAATWNVLSRLFTGRFPSTWEQVILKNSAIRATMDRVALLDILEEAGPFINSDNPEVLFEFGKDTVVLSVNGETEGHFRQELPCSIVQAPRKEGADPVLPSLVAAFNPWYLINYLSVVEVEEVEWRLQDANTALTAISEIPGELKYTFACMPRRL